MPPYTKVVMARETQTPDAYLSNVNLSLPSLPANTINLPDYLAYDYAIQPCRPRYKPSKAGACPQSLHTIHCLSFLHEASKKLKVANGDILAVCGNRIVALYGLTPADQSLPFDVMNVWEDEMDEEYYTVRWGLVLEDSGSYTPWLAAGGKFGLIKVLDVHSNRVVKFLCGHKNSIRDLAFLTNAHYLLSCSDDFSVRLWHVPNHVQIAIFHGMEGHDRPVLCLDLHDSEQLFLSGGMDRTVKLWSISEELRVEMEAAKGWDTIPIMKDGVEYATRPFRTKLEYKPVFSSQHLHKGFVDCAKFYGNFIVSKCQEGVVMVWKVNEVRRSVVIIKEVRLPPQCIPCFPLRFALYSELSLLIAGGDHSDLHCYQILEDGSDAYLIVQHGSVPGDHIVTYVALSSSSETIVACTNKGALLRFDAD